MNIYIPPNIFSAILSLSLPDDLKSNIIVKDSSLIAQLIKEDESGILLLPSIDLIKNRELYVSRNYGIAFDGMLSNSYLYFAKNETLFEELFLYGDVSTNDIILTKILFKERYNIDVKISLETKSPSFGDRNYLICGNDNLFNGYYSQGISVADEIAELIDFPYVNYIFAAKEKQTIVNFHEKITDKLDIKIEDNIASYLEKMQLDKEPSRFITENINSIYFQLLENEIEGLDELLKQTYFHGILTDLFEINYV
ncbi:MAG: hypothetical protein K9I99_09125, partial [Melioribacteraceae bacterium]|nr:hypothetical protein [Melioribacteraceae bacterium]